MRCGCGLERGFLYGWIATVAAAVVDYCVGHFARRFAVKSFNGVARRRVLCAMRDRPFLASLLIRKFPTAPFLVVNVAFGLARASFWRFLVGLVLGVAPKTAVVVFGVKAVMAAISGNVAMAIAAAVACGAIIVVGAALSRRFVDERAFTGPEETTPLTLRLAGSAD